jgi:hypothetical protein
MGTWRPFDLEDLPPRDALMRLARGAGMFTGATARFLCVTAAIQDRGSTGGVCKLEGPWVIGYPFEGRARRPLVYLPTAWDWFDESAESETEESLMVGWTKGTS